MKESPLDEVFDFHPAPDERPAGAWMQGYWRKLAWRSLSFGIGLGIWAVWTCGKVMFFYYSMLFDASHYMPTHLDLSLTGFLGVLLMCALAYFIIRFALHLNNAVRQGAQKRLEAAFAMMRPMLWLLLLVALASILSTLQYFFYLFKYWSAQHGE